MKKIRKEPSITRSFSLPLSMLSDIEDIADVTGSNPNRACREAFRMWIEHKKAELEKAAS